MGVDRAEFLQVSVVTFLFLGSTYQNIRYMLSQSMFLIKIELLQLI